MDIISKLLELVGPTVVALATVPLMGLLKKGLALLDKAPAMLQQILVILIAFGLTQLGGVVNVALPTDLSLFTESDLGALLSAGMAMAIHAGTKAKK